jgi:hypothetical protein
LQTTLAGYAMRISPHFRSSFLEGGDILQATGLPDHPTLGGELSYQGMSEHREATIGAMVNSALCLRMPYEHNEFGGPK